jgi:hypothetical protein
LAASYITDLTPDRFLEYTPQELAGVLFYLNKNEEAKLNAEWERTRIQTWHLLNIQIDKKNKIDYEQFKNSYWPFVWEKTALKEVPVIDWDEKDRIDKDRQSSTYHTEVLHF